VFLDIELKLENKQIPNSLKLSDEQELLLEENIVWLFGPRRSGTTWLGKQLLSHNTHYMHEPDLTSHLELSMNQAGKKFQRRIDDRKNIENYFFAERYKNIWLFFLGKLIIYRIYAQFQSYTKKIIVKEPSSLLDASDIISKATPNSKIVILVRDGRDIIDSLLDARQEGGWLARRAQDALKSKTRKPFIEQRANYWNIQMENLLRAYENHREDSRYMVKYEELRKNPSSILNEIYGFLGIKITEEELYNLVDRHSFEKIPTDQKGKGKFTRSATPGKWQENFNDSEKKIMNDIMFQTLEKLGYE